MTRTPALVTRRERRGRVLPRTRLKQVDVRSEFENAVRGEERGHARNENISCGSVHVWVGEDLSTHVCGRSPMHDKLECGCKEHARTHIAHARVDAGNTSEKMEQTGTWVHQVSRAKEEQLKEDKQELNTREQKQRMHRVYEGLFMRTSKKRNKSCAI